MAGGRAGAPVAVSEALRLLPIDAATYVGHSLHAPDRDWPETNCYVDLWVEVLHALGHDPVAGLAFTLAVGFDGDQWEFFKYPAEDLLTLYGIQVREINVWRSLEDHIATHLALGHLLTVEAMELYLEHLRDADSLIAVHISNRYLDLEPVVQGLAEELGLAVIRIDDDHEDERVFSSDWMLLATQPGAFEGVRALADPAELEPKRSEWPLWTDTYSNVVQVLK